MNILAGLGLVSVLCTVAIIFWLFTKNAETAVPTQDRVDKKIDKIKDKINDINNTNKERDREELIPSQE